jgi:RNA polymerase sigma factor (TIGR02999 family)
MLQASETVAQLMAAFRQGDKAAANKLTQLLYPELRRLAAARMKGERTDHTWQPTVLVHELYLELIKIKALRPAGLDDDEKAAFLRLSAHLMKRLLIHHARPLNRRVQKVEIEESPDLSTSAEDTMREIEEALARLAGIKPQLRMVVEMKVFEELTVDEIAQRLGCASVTVARYWSFAKQWLQEELTAGRRL